MASVDIRLNHSGIKEAALTSPEVRGQLRKMAEAMAARARTQTDLEIEVTEGVGRSRAGARVWMLGAQAARVEAKHRILGRSLTNGG